MAVCYAFHLLGCGRLLYTGRNRTRRDRTPRYLELAKSICEKSRLYGDHPRSAEEKHLASALGLSNAVPLAASQPGGLSYAGLSDFSLSTAQSRHRNAGRRCLAQPLTVAGSGGNAVLLFLPFEYAGSGVWLGISLLGSLGGLAYVLTLYSEVLFVFLLIPAYGFAYRYWQRPLTRSLVFGALLFAAAFYVRASALYSPVLLVLVFGLALLRKGADKRRMWDLLAFILISAMALSPWLLRDYHHYGAPYISAQMSNMLAYWHVPILESRLHGTALAQNRQRMYGYVARCRQRRACTRSLPEHS
jgi:hypothetical protein